MNFNIVQLEINLKKCFILNSYSDGLRRVPDPVSATFHPGGHYGLVSEKMDLSIDNYFNTKLI